ncbi:MAG TPA: hypothetical protein VF698_02040 [Thermoanaerobaculia bacterium]|jgi:hypothetical protein
MVELAKLTAFLLFLALGIAAARDRRAVRYFAGYTILISLFSGATQIDVWPFTSYTLAAFRPRPHVTICSVEIVGVDARGREWAVDPLSWSPHYHSIVQYWLDAQWTKLPREQQRETLRYLARRAEQARAAGTRTGFRRYLGAAYDPYWWLLRRPAATSPAPYVALRLYRTCADPDDQVARGTKPRRTLIAEERP